MSQLNQSSEYNRLFEQYSKKSNEELAEIIKPENGYTEVAIKVASDILQSERTDYYENVMCNQQRMENEQKINTDEVLLNLSRDIHSIKNMLLFFVILTVVGIIFFFYLVYVDILMFM